MTGFWQRLQRGGRAIALGAFVLAAGGSAAFLAAKAPGPQHTAAAAPPAPAADHARLRRDGPAGLRVPEAVAKNMGLKTAPVPAAARPVMLPPFQGTLAHDSSRLFRVHSRFAGEVVALAERTDPPLPGSPSAPAPRAVRKWDAVKKGEVLAVVWSKDLGEKKSELVDALSRLRADETTLTRLTEAYRKDGSIPEKSLRDAERAVEADRIAAERAERTLRSWRLTDPEIEAVRAEAGRVGAKATKADLDNWAKVEIRCPQDGVLLEHNVEVGAMVDPAADLFKVGDLTQLTVWAHVYEEDLPLVQALPVPVRWDVHVPSRPGLVFHGTMENVGAVIDPAQHTALVTGRVENLDQALKVGQYVTVSLETPAPAGEVELPAGAVVEDGRESVVFVQPNPAELRFVRTPVQVARRFRDGVCVRADGAVRPGDRVVTGGALLLRDAMDLLPAQ